MAVKIFLDNKEKWNVEYKNRIKGTKGLKKPLLIVAYTNHALDQFLNHILHFTNNIARVGGRCADENIKKFSLAELRRTEKDKTYIRHFRELRETIESLHEIRRFLFRVSKLKFHQFLECLPKDHIRERKKQLGGIFEDFGYYFVNPPCDNTMGKLFDLWRDGVILDKKTLKQFVDNEIKFEKNKLQETYDDDDDEFFDNAPKAKYVPKIREEEKNENFPQNNNLNYEYDSSEADDPELEENRRLENDYEENMDYFKHYEADKSNAKLFFSQAEYDLLIKSNLYWVKYIWEFTLPERQMLINYCFMQNFDKYDDKFKRLLVEYKKYMDDVDKQRIARDLRILMSKKIVGVTVSGCAKYSHYLERLESPITIIEEAAEVLETHTISVLTKHTQHLIMIGDHQQLKPHVESYDLEKKFNFNISLFERLINNGINYVSLRQQRRMRPEFADFMRVIYKNYDDHESVQKYENIKGVKTNMFFFNHDKPEAENSGLKSKVNPFEAEMISGFSLYLIQQNYKEDQITILSMYVGQTLAIKAQLKKRNLMRIRVTTVDNYQGEENDIIILSLVRSNKNKKLGFVKSENRTCVALSRARKGLFVFGDLQFIYRADGSFIWKKILDVAKTKKVWVDKINLCCQNHQMELFVTKPEDFKNAPEGGCKKICDIRKECGHIW